MRAYRSFLCGCVVFSLVFSFPVWSIDDVPSSEVLLQEARGSILSLWEVFDLLNACRITKDLRKDFEGDCFFYAQSTLKVLVELLGYDDLDRTETVLLANYFAAMRDSFENSCKEKTLMEKRIACFFKTIQDVFELLMPNAQNVYEQDNPNRCCACIAAFLASA